MKLIQTADNKQSLFFYCPICGHRIKAFFGDRVIIFDLMENCSHLEISGEDREFIVNLRGNHFIKEIA